MMDTQLVSENQRQFFQVLIMACSRPKHPDMWFGTDLPGSCQTEQSPSPLMTEVAILGHVPPATSTEMHQGHHAAHLLEHHSQCVLCAGADSIFFNC